MDREIPIKHYELYAHPKIKLVGLRLLDEKREKEITISTSPHDALLFGLQLLELEIPPTFLHDVLCGMVEMLKGQLVKVVIYDIVEAKFRSQLHIATPKKQIFTIEISPPDALAIALRAKVPVFLMESVIEKERAQRHKVLNWYEYNAEYTLEVLNNATPEELKRQSPVELEIFLEKAVEAEDYELAKKIRNAVAETG